MSTGARDKPQDIRFQSKASDFQPARLAKANTKATSHGSLTGALEDPDVEWLIPLHLKFKQKAQLLRSTPSILKPHILWTRILGCGWKFNSASFRCGAPGARFGQELTRSVLPYGILLD